MSLSPSHAAMCNDADAAYEREDREARWLRRFVTRRAEREAAKIRRAAEQLSAIADRIEAARDLEDVYALQDYVTDLHEETDALDDLLAEGLEAVAIRMRRDLE